MCEAHSFITVESIPIGCSFTSIVCWLSSFIFSFGRQFIDSVLSYHGMYYALRIVPFFVPPSSAWPLLSSSLSITITLFHQSAILLHRSLVVTFRLRFHLQERNILKTNADRNTNSGFSSMSQGYSGIFACGPESTSRAS